MVGQTRIYQTGLVRCRTCSYVGGRRGYTDLLVYIEKRNEYKCVWYSVITFPSKLNEVYVKIAKQVEFAVVYSTKSSLLI